MIYRKQGATVRLERLRGARSVVALTERGWAEETGRAFRCASSDTAQAPYVDTAPVLDVETAIEDAGAPIERLTIVAGIARHEFGEARWSETQVRLHASLVHGDRRVILDLGGPAWSSELTALVERAADALGRCHGALAEGPIVLAPHVSAQLWPEVLLAILESPLRAPIELSQSTHPELSRDGFGAPIEPFVLFDGSMRTAPERWPNHYRPSYRARPARAAFHLRASLQPHAGEWERQGIALLEPFRVREGRVRATVLCSDGSIAPIDSALTDLRSASGMTETWVPVSAGSWGGEVVVLR